MLLGTSADEIAAVEDELAAVIDADDVFQSVLTRNDPVDYVGDVGIVAELTVLLFGAVVHGQGTLNGDHGISESAVSHSAADLLKLLHLFAVEVEVDITLDLDEFPGEVVAFAAVFDALAHLNIQFAVVGHCFLELVAVLDDDRVKAGSAALAARDRTADGVIGNRRRYRKRHHAGKQRQREQNSDKRACYSFHQSFLLF